MPDFGFTSITRTNASSIQVSGPLPSWTGVKFTWDNETIAEAGDNTGRVMVIQNPWASQEIAQNLLAQIRNDVYLPFRATDIILDPAVEVGDAVYLPDGISGVYSMDVTMDSLFSADISAPADEEIDHEFPYSEPSNIDKKDIDNAIEDALDDGGAINTAFDDFVADALDDGGAISNAIVDIDSLFTRGKDHVEITADHMALVTGYDPHAEEGETPEPVTADTKLYIGYEYSGQTQGGDAILSPVIILGAGNAGGTNVARIRKDTNGFDLTYDTNNPNVPQEYIRMTPDGKIEIYPLDLSSVYESLVDAEEGTSEEKAIYDNVRDALKIPILEQDVTQMKDLIQYISNHYFRAEIVSSLPGSPESNVLYFVPE